MNKNNEFSFKWFHNLKSEYQSENVHSEMIWLKEKWVARPKIPMQDQIQDPDPIQTNEQPS